MSLATFFKKAGVDIDKVLGIGIDLAKVFEPEVDILFPALGPLYNGAVNEASTLMAAGSAAAAQGGSASVQLENVAAAVAPQLIAYCEQQVPPLPAPTAAHITAFTQSLLVSLQVLVAIENGTAPTVTVSSTSSPAATAPAAAPAPVASAAPAAVVAQPLAAD
jgi:hypothetical protein